MGLPANLATILKTMGQGNYPAGASPWSGQPAGVPPTNPYFLPNAPLPAEYVAYFLGILAITAQGVLDAAGRQNALNWPVVAAVQPITGSAAITKAAAGQDTNGAFTFWGATDGSIGTATNTLAVVRSKDGGKTFESTNFPQSAHTSTGTQSISLLLADNAGNAFACHQNNGSTNLLAGGYSFNGSSWSGLSTLGAGASGTFTTGYWDPTHSYFVIGGGSFGTLPAGSTTLTTWSLPSPPGSLSGSSAAAHLFTDGAGTGFYFNDGWPYVARFTDCHSSGTFTYPAFPIGVSDIVVGGDFSAMDGWLIATWTGSVTNIIGSSNGTVWAVKGTSLATQIVSLKCIGGHTWVAVDVLGFIYYSTDGGTTFTFSFHRVAGNIFSLAGMVRNVGASQLLVYGQFGHKNVNNATETSMAIASAVTG